MIIFANNGYQPVSRAKFLEEPLKERSGRYLLWRRYLREGSSVCIPSLDREISQDPSSSHSSPWNSLMNSWQVMRRTISIPLVQISPLAFNLTHNYLEEANHHETDYFLGRRLDWPPDVYCFHSFYIFVLAVAIRWFLWGGIWVLFLTCPSPLCQLHWSFTLRTCHFLPPLCT